MAEPDTTIQQVRQTCQDSGVVYTPPTPQQLIESGEPIPSFSSSTTYSGEIIVEGQRNIVGTDVGQFERHTYGQELGEAFRRADDNTIGDASQALRRGDVRGAIGELINNPGDTLTAVIGRAARERMPSDDSPDRRDRGRY